MLPLAPLKGALKALPIAHGFLSERLAGLPAVLQLEGLYFLQLALLLLLRLQR